MDDFHAGLLCGGIANALVAAGIPVDTVAMSPGNVGPMIVTYQRTATPQQIAQGGVIVAAYGLLPRAPRQPLAVYADLLALTPQQQANVWTDLSSNVVVGTLTVKKYLTDVGPNFSGIAALDWALSDSGATGLALTHARMRIAMVFVIDNPTYLVTPAFDPTITLWGAAPMPVS
jgi:hypothetical protein